jgi:hypothetical protein
MSHRKKMSLYPTQHSVRRNLRFEAIEQVATKVGMLDSLDIPQLIMAFGYFENISKQVNDHQIGQFIDVDEWFFTLSDVQQNQVITYGRSLNVGKQIAMVANWYEGYGQNGAFRFEMPLPYPVASR